MLDVLCFDIPPCVSYYKMNAKEVLSNCFPSMPHNGIMETYAHRSPRGLPSALRKIFIKIKNKKS